MNEARKKAYRVRRICPGLYELHQTIAGQSCIVSVYRRRDLKGWIAAANWDKFTYTDPVPTKWQAVQNGEMMLLDREGVDNLPKLDRANA